MIERTTDIAKVNSVINHPAVRPFVGAPDAGVLDAAPIIDEPNWWLMGDHGGFALTWTAPGVREVHTMILPEGRGEWAAQARQEGIDYARENGTHMLWTAIPPGAPHVEAFAKRGGMRDTGKTIDQFGKPYKVYSMELVKCQ